MTINLIGLDTVKAQLGLADTTYDAQITAMLPIVSADVRRILNRQFNEVHGAVIESGEATIEAGDMFDLGTVLTGDGIPLDTYIASFNWETSEYTMTANATADSDWLNPTVNISQWPAISKMVWYKIQKQSISGVEEKAAASESIGSISVTYTDAEINSKWSYPQVLIDDLGTPWARVG